MTQRWIGGKKMFLPVGTTIIMKEFRIDCIAVDIYNLSYLDSDKDIDYTRRFTVLELEELVQLIQIFIGE